LLHQHHEKETTMGIYDVLLGIDRAARDTKRRLTIRVLAADRLSAAIAAEQVGDAQVREPATEYCHAIRVNPLHPDRPPRPAAIMPRPQDVLLAA
jgi:hypothetical protein